MIFDTFVDFWFSRQANLGYRHVIILGDNVLIIKVRSIISTSAVEEIPRYKDITQAEFCVDFFFRWID